VSIKTEVLTGRRRINERANEDPRGRRPLAQVGGDPQVLAGAGDPATEFKAGRGVLYKREDVDEWVTQQYERESGRRA